MKRRSTELPPRADSRLVDRFNERDLYTGLRSMAVRDRCARSGHSLRSINRSVPDRWVAPENGRWCEEKVAPNADPKRNVAVGASPHALTRETIAKHRETADGFRFGRLILKNVPVLGELAVFETDDVGGDPGAGRPMPEKRPWAMT